MECSARYGPLRRPETKHRQSVDSDKKPPSTDTVVPVTAEPPGPQSQTIIVATSPGSKKRSIGCWAAKPGGTGQVVEHMKRARTRPDRPIRDNSSRHFTPAARPLDRSDLQDVDPPHRLVLSQLACLETYGDRWVSYGFNV